MYTIIFSSAFKKSFRQLIRQKPKINEEIETFFKNIQNKIPLPESFKDHSLKGDYKGCRECHLFPDILLIYKINDNILELLMIDIGTHSDPFE